jgi:ribosomal protein S18 acetylase RimI-like enzyme
MLKDIALPDALGLRLAHAADEVFMEELFRSTRAHFYALPMLRQQIDLLVAQQYRLQQASYARQWPEARNIIIERAGRAIGKIVLDEGATCVHIVDFVIEPGMRRKGCGTSVLRAIQESAARQGLAVKLSVDRQNPLAKKLYLGLGFSVDATSATHESMSWCPSVLQRAGGQVCMRPVFLKQQREERDNG